MADVFEDAEGFGDFDGEEIDREWHAREAQFKNLGYRDGVSAGKEASAQEGFDEGFRQGAKVGHNWGQVRGATSAFAILPAEVKDALFGSHGRQSVDRAAELWLAVSSISSNEAGASLCGESIAPTTTATQEQTETPRFGLEEVEPPQDATQDTSCCRKLAGDDRGTCCRAEPGSQCNRATSSPVGSEDGRMAVAEPAGPCGSPEIDTCQNGVQDAQENEAIQSIRELDLHRLSLEIGGGGGEKGRLMALQHDVWEEFRKAGVQPREVQGHGDGLVQG